MAGIAQLVEQWIENPRVSSSNLDLGTNRRKYVLEIKGEKRFSTEFKILTN